MITMPRRNVTRFAIPLIDVLILLFCIFLLMDFNAESKADVRGEMVDDQSEKIELLDADLRKRTQELHKFEELRPRLEEFDKLLQRNAELEKANQQSLQEKADIRIIDINPKDGSLSYYDSSNPANPYIAIDSAEKAKLLIDRHKKEAKGRTLYYYFLFPRTGRYRLGVESEQEETYKRWFNVPNSLKKVEI
jgi:hypothetical protein